MTVTFTMEAMLPRERRTKSGKIAKPRAERPTITVQSRGNEVLVWIDRRAKWPERARERAAELRALAVKNLGVLTASLDAGGYHNLIASGPRTTFGESRRSAMLRLLCVLRRAARASKTHTLRPFKPTPAELGHHLSEGASRARRRDFNRDLTALVQAADASDEELQAAKRAAREAKKAAREAAKEARHAA